MLGDDLGSEREIREPRPCCRRIRMDSRVGWCLKEDGHELRGDPVCVGAVADEPPPADFGPAYKK